MILFIILKNNKMSEKELQFLRKWYDETKECTTNIDEKDIPDEYKGGNGTKCDCGSYYLDEDPQYCPTCPSTICEVCEMSCDECGIVYCEDCGTTKTTTIECLESCSNCCEYCFESVKEDFIKGIDIQIQNLGKEKDFVVSQTFN